MKYYWMCWSLLLSYFAVAQEQDIMVYDYTIYFETDRFTPTSQQLKGLTTFLEEMAFNGSLQQIIIAGHTDKRASETYNLTLSKNRAAAIKTYLTQYYQEKGKQLPALESIFHGEEQPSITNATKKERGQNRRVTIQWIFEQPVPPAPLPEPLVEEVPQVMEEPFSPIEEQDMSVVLNVRDYLFFMPSQESADEAEIEVIKTSQEAYAATITTVTTDGKLLNSYGMFRVCGDPDLESITVRVPVMDTTAPAPNYYDRVGDRWELTSRPITKVLDKETGQWYYELEAENCKWINLDTVTVELGIIIRAPITPFWVKKIHLLNNNPIQNYPIRARGLKVHTASGFAPERSFLEDDSSSTKTVIVEMLGQPSSQNRTVKYIQLVRTEKRVLFPMQIIKPEQLNRRLDNGHDGYTRVSRMASLFVKTRPLAHVIYRIRAKDLRQARKDLRQEWQAEKEKAEDIGGL
ncbi:MAG: OmpA family protein [Aureispira sp.]